MSGLEVLEAQITGELPRPPVSHLFGMKPVEVGESTATFALPATEWLCSPLAKVEGGVIAMLADAALASAIQTTVPAGVALAMVDLKVSFSVPRDPTVATSSPAEQLFTADARWRSPTLRLETRTASRWRLPPARRCILPPVPPHWPGWPRIDL